jgi:hypothetical protein
MTQHAAATRVPTEGGPVVDRRGRTVTGRLLAAVSRLSGRKVFCDDLAKALRRLQEADPVARGERR